MAVQQPFVFFLVVTALVRLNAATAEDILAGDAQNLPLDALVLRLGDVDFEQRISARQQLTRLEAPQISEIAEIAQTHSSAEVSVGIVDVLSEILLARENDRTRRTAAWEALERLTSSHRLLVQEAAAHTLTEQWNIRARLAIDALRAHGALVIVPPELNEPNVGRQTPRQFQGFLLGMPPTDDSIRVMLDQDWKGDTAAFDLLERLPDVTPLLIPPLQPSGRRRFFPGVRRPQLSVFLIDGHKLPKEDENRLRQIVGDARVSNRGTVMLGISSQPGFSEDGCMISAVTEGGSAHAAGLRAGDRITRLEGTEIRSFDDLVDELKKYRIGDTVNVVVGRQGVPTDIEVRLRGWREYVMLVNDDTNDEAVPEDPEN